MIMLYELFIRNMDVVYLIHGLAFLFIGFIILFQLRVTEKSEFKLQKILWLLAFFGATHGIHEIIEMFSFTKGEDLFLIVPDAVFVFVSYLFLFQFGYQLFNLSSAKKLKIWFPSVVLILFFALQAYFGLNSSLNVDLWLISTIYIIGFPGAILTAIGFYLYYQSEYEKLSRTEVKKYFIIASLFFISYAILEGLMFPGYDLFPAFPINSFDLQVPIQVFGSINSVIIAWSLWHVVNIFNIEESNERRRSETKIREQAALLDKARDIIIVCDLEHRITYWNKSAVQVYGFTEEEAAGRNANDLLFKEISPALIEAGKRVIEEGEWAGELNQVTKNGKEITVESRWTLVRNGEGNPRSILVFNTDVTEKNRLLSDLNERKKIEQALKMFAMALEEAPDGVQIVGLDGRIIYSNKTVEKIYGFSPEEFRGKNVGELNEDPEFADKVIIPDLKMTGHWSGVLKVKHKNGSTFPVLLNTSVFKDDSGKPLAMVGIIRDITEQLAIEKLEKQLLQSDKLATIGQLAAGVAHEINNPLGNISLYAQMLLKTIDDENVWNKVNIINDEADRAANIVRGLLDFARQSEPSMSPTNINGEITKVLNILEYELKDIKVITSFQDLPDINCDPGQISQVLMNILSNSFQAITSNGIITIETKGETNYVEIVISDNGCGIPEENLDKIFDPFFTTKKPGEGTGLGLSISYGIIKSHNGSIDVKSEVGKGTTFIIKLPK